MSTPRRYAEGTRVAPEKSKGQIEKLLRQHGADGFLSGWDSGIATLMFRMHGRTVRFSVVIPDASEYVTAGRRRRSPKEAAAAAEQEHRRRWRSLLLIIKAKLELVSSGDSSFEREFLADIMLPDGSTVGEWMVPQIDAVATAGAMPKMLPGAK